MEVESITTILKSTIEYGVFFGLFISLLVYTIKQNEKREKSYQDLIDSLNYKILLTASNNSDKLGSVTEDIAEIDSKVQHISDKVDIINAKVDTIDKKVEMLPYKLGGNKEWINLLIKLQI